MHNAIVTLNFRRCLCRNTRLSLLDAVRRWGVHFLEYKKEVLRDHFPSWEKLRIWSRLLQFDLILLLDADMLVSEHCPNPFEVFADPDRLYVARDNQPQQAAHSGIINEEIYGPFHSIMSDYFRLPLTKDDYLAGLFNTGMILVSPGRHKDFFDRLEAVVPLPESLGDLRLKGHFEQALVNYFAKSLIPDAIEYIPETWNFLNPIGMGRQFIYHFTGIGRDEVRKYLPTFEWRV